MHTHMYYVHVYVIIYIYIHTRKTITNQHLELNKRMTSAARACVYCRTSAHNVHYYHYY